MEVNIVAPDKIVFSEKNAKLVTLPGMEGNLGIMDKHTPIITFLRPGLIKIEGEINNSFFVTGGVIDFQDDKLNILTDLVFNTNEINSDVVNKLKSEAEEKLKNDNLSDKDIFISNTLINEIENLNFK
ncbi:MAG: ATP synthase F1 subunit epsilon [Candidatus Pelagibacter sp.]|nr:ATP synthase F1 subunit epsilon [Candidatus Pelagibacter sp.]|tara:strand:- start:62413 stop:62796 length:384 start_codon:yes stop_codon:yes gene_type:complete